MTRSRNSLLALVATLALLALPAAAAPNPPGRGDTQAPRAVAGAPGVFAVDDAAGRHEAATPKAGSREKDTWILHLSTPPLATYCGGVDELPPTCAEATGRAKLDPNSPASRSYLEYLDAVQNRVVTAIETLIRHPLIVKARYRYAFSGLAVILTDAEALLVANVENVIRVEPGVIEALATDVGPRWIGAGGIWDGSQTGGLPGTMGEGVVVGIIDTGINMDHPSFAAVGGDGYQHINPRGTGKFLGWCDPTNTHYKPEYVCNDKLIGAWSYAGNTPEDENEHGSHTSSTVAGNVLPAAALIAPTTAITRMISGVAPHANIIMYEACHPNCPSSGTTAAIDQATADGVDAINYSIATGQDSPWLNSRHLAFKGASAAGVFVAVSAGNAGPGAYTTNAVAPWVTAVAASTHTRKLTNRLVQMAGGDTAAPPDMIGASFTNGLTQTAIIYAAGKLDPAGVADDGRCLLPFPAGTFHGEIVVCDRGTNARVDKATNVAAGGAAGFVLANNAASGESVVADAYDIPGVHISFVNGQTLKTWLKTGTGHKAAIEGTSVSTKPENADIMADFSGRGGTLGTSCCRRPNLDIDQVELDVLKPDVTAPGVDIMAAIATLPGGPPAPEFGLLSGTSMSGPHTAGAGALLRALHPNWTNSQIQSALMLTAVTAGVKKEDGTTNADPHDYGNGRINLAEAGRSGLLMSVTNAEYDASDPDKGGSIAALNRASLANASCLGTCRWIRTLENTQDQAVNWKVSVAPITGETALPTGLKLTVSPTTFTIPAKGKQTIQVDADVLGLELDTWAFAQILVEPDGANLPKAHLSVAIKRVDVKIPPAVVIQTNQTIGTHAVTGLVAPEITDLTLEPVGLVKGTQVMANLMQDPTTADPYDSITSTLVITVDLPAGTRRLVAETTASTAQDIDLYFTLDANGNGRPEAAEQVCVSGYESWQEFCDLVDPPAGRYHIVLNNFAATNPTDSVTLLWAMVPPAPSTNMTVTGPKTVVAYKPFDVSVGWNLPTLMPGDHWYGAFDLGTDMANAGNIGTIVVDLIGLPGAVATPTAVPPTVPPTAVPPTPLPPTAIPPTSVPPTATPAGLVRCICGIVQGRVPAQAINDAAANPDRVYGWRQPMNPGLPVSPFNPLRECLSLQNIAVPYHPTNNSLVFKASCP